MRLGLFVQAFLPLYHDLRFSSGILTEYQRHVSNVGTRERLTAVDSVESCVSDSKVSALFVCAPRDDWAFADGDDDSDVGIDSGYDSTQAPLVTVAPTSAPGVRLGSLAPTSASTSAPTLFPPSFTLPPDGSITIPPDFGGVGDGQDPIGDTCGFMESWIGLRVHGIFGLTRFKIR